MPAKLPDQKRLLSARGVRLPQPETVFIGAEVAPERIAAGVTIHPGCRLTGRETSIGPGCELGACGPVTLCDCQLGESVSLGGGYFEEATFLNRSCLASGAHVRSGTLVEEEARGGHTVGLKQTILFPYTVLGSLINFCDCLFAGGTSRQNHSEVGSSYVHFNYTPHQDKATASLLGDVPQGVMLQAPPIFLGGQGGLVGPARVAFGAVIPAGTVLRGDVLQSGLYRGARAVPAATDARAASGSAYRQGAYLAIERLVVNNLIYMGNIIALRAWYRHVRGPLMRADQFQEACLAGAQARLASVSQERLKRLEELAGKMPASLELARSAKHDLTAKPYRQQRALIEHWPMLRDGLEKLEREEGLPAGGGAIGDQGLPAGGGAIGDQGSLRDRDIVLEAFARQRAGTSYLDAVQALTPDARAAGTAWLQSLADSAAALWRT